MNGFLRKCLSVAASAALAACAWGIVEPAEAQAAASQVGKYVVNYYTHKPKPSPNGTTAYRGTQSVKILAYNARTKKVKLRFYFCTCHYGSDFHSWATWAKVKNGKARIRFGFGLPFTAVLRASDGKILSSKRARAGVSIG